MKVDCRAPGDTPGQAAASRDPWGPAQTSRSLTFTLQEVQTDLEGKRKSISPKRPRKKQLLPGRCPTSTPASRWAAGYFSISLSFNSQVWLFSLRRSTPKILLSLVTLFQHVWA